MHPRATPKKPGLAGYPVDILKLSMILLLDGNSELGKRKEQSVFLDLLKAFDKIMRNHISDFFLSKKSYFPIYHLIYVP